MNPPSTETSDKVAIVSLILAASGIIWLVLEVVRLVIIGHYNTSQTVTEPQISLTQSPALLIRSSEPSELSVIKSYNNINDCRLDLTKTLNQGPQQKVHLCVDTSIKLK